MDYLPVFLNNEVVGIIPKYLSFKDVKITKDYVKSNIRFFDGLGVDLKNHDVYYNIKEVPYNTLPIEVEVNHLPDIRDERVVTIWCLIIE